MQFRPLRLQFDRPAEFGDGAIKILGKIQHAAQSPMRLRIAGSQARGFLRLAECAGHVPFAKERVREVYMRLHKIRLQFQSALKLLDCGIHLALGEQHPAKRVVSFGALWRQTNDLLERGARGIQIALLKIRQP